MYDSNEMSPRNFAPLGIPGNPLDGTPGAQDARRPQKWWDKGTKKPLALPGRLNYQEMADVGTPPKGVPLAQSPEQLLVPDVVSATDPAYSQHPFIRQVLSSLSRIPASTSGGDTPWAQMGPGKMTTIQLVNGLRPRMQSVPYKKQGTFDSVGTN